MSGLPLMPLDVTETARVVARAEHLAAAVGLPLFRQANRIWIPRKPFVNRDTPIHSV
jgi:hypothetical protein